MTNIPDNHTEDVLDLFFKQAMKYAIKPDMNLDSIVGIGTDRFMRSIIPYETTAASDIHLRSNKYRIKKDTEIFPAQRFQSVESDVDIVKPLPLKTLTVDLTLNENQVYVPINASYKLAVCFFRDHVNHQHDRWEWRYTFFVRMKDIYSL